MKRPLTGVTPAGLAVLSGLVLALVVGLGAVLRLDNLDQTPGLYSDEGTLLNIAHNLLQGRWQYMAITESPLLATRMPVFLWLLTLASRLFGEGIVTLRVLTGLTGVVSIVLVYALVRILSIPRARETALVAALVLAIHPNAVAYSRLGLSYNLLAPIVLLAVAAAYRFLHGGGNRSLFLAGLLIGLGTVTDLEVLVVLPPLLLIALYRGWRPALRLLAAALILPGLYVVYMLATAPQAFLFDLQFTFSLFFTLPVLVQLAVAIANFGGLLRWDPWLIPSLIGLFMLRPMRVRWFLLLCFMLPLLLVARSVLGLPLRTYHYLIPILPLAAVGTSYLLVQGVLVVAQTFHEGVARLAAVWKLIGRSRGMDWAVARLQHWTGALAVFLFVVSPFLISTMLLYGDIQRQLKTPAEALLVDQSEARQVAAYLNARTAADDLVIASPALAWLLTARVADFQLALAYEGKPTVHFPANIPPERFAYPISPDRARFVVIDPVWRNWAAVEMPEVAKLVAEVETWPVAFAAGEVTVYANPAVRTP